MPLGLTDIGEEILDNVFRYLPLTCLPRALAISRRCSLRRALLEELAILSAPILKHYLDLLPQRWKQARGVACPLGAPRYCARRTLGRLLDVSEIWEPISVIRPLFLALPRAGARLKLKALTHRRPVFVDIAFSLHLDGLASFRIVADYLLDDPDEHYVLYLTMNYCIALPGGEFTTASCACSPRERDRGLIVDDEELTRQVFGEALSLCFIFSAEAQECNCADCRYWSSTGP